MKTEIYYFSGTGNSFFAARELQKRLPGAELIPLVTMLDQKVITPGAESVGLVFPVYMISLPIPVKQFIAKLDVSRVKYLFGLATRLGTAHRAFQDIDKGLKKKGRRLDAWFNCTMAGNSPAIQKNWVTSSGSEIAAMEAVVLKQLDNIGDIVVKQKTCREKDTLCNMKIPSFLLAVAGLLGPLMEKASYKNGFYADSKCSKCGLCEKVCLSGKISMEGGAPVWNENKMCYNCYACLTYCPEQAVQIQKTYTDINGRYSHPYATVEDIIRQKKVDR